VQLRPLPPLFITLLTGNARLTMWNGCATVDELRLKASSMSMELDLRRMFRIGVQVVPGSYFGGRIVEAITPAFTVEYGDHSDLRWRRVRNLNRFEYEDVISVQRRIFFSRSRLHAFFIKKKCRKNGKATDTRIRK
jgi:hypothetical protein